MIEVSRFADEYADLAALLDEDPERLREHDHRHAATRPRWMARDDGRPVGAAVMWQRPDNRCAVFFEGCATHAYQPLAHAIATEIRRDLYTGADDTEHAVLGHLHDAGFRLIRHEHHYQLSTQPDRHTPMPEGYSTIGADTVPLRQLATLDSQLRQDTPGADGWAVDEVWFREETYDSPAFDPATYRVAVHEPTNTLCGIARIWWNPQGPRLGFIATLDGHRRRGLARALLCEVMAVARDRGHTEVPCEVDGLNGASHATLAVHSPRRVGGDYELIRRA
jgi:GNAT superfamily N-acetyltransferase